MDTIERAAAAAGDAFVLRPGVLMPDWSLVTDASARDALAAIMADAGRAEKWARLDPDEDGIWQAVLRGFAATGRAPDARSLAVVAGLDESAVSGWLHSLRRRDLVVLGADGAVTAAYPFCAWDSGHRIRFGALTVNSLCAIDTLGAGAMVGRDTVIESSCPACDVAIRVTTRNRGRDFDAVTPATAVVWSGIRYADNCAATSGCTVKRFFCSDEHLASWRQRVDPKGAGFRLPLEAAFQVGKALFVPMLVYASEPTGASA
jgi:hypothetical protein